MFIPVELQARRREVLYGARRLCEERGLDIPGGEVEAALIDGMWPKVLEPLDATRKCSRGLVREPVSIYNSTLWDLKDYMAAAMLKDKFGYGGVRAFYALIGSDRP